MPEIEIEQDGCVSIKIPMSLRRLSGRKRVISADDYKTALYSGKWFAQRGRKGLHKLCCRRVNQLSKSA